ncbi:hypothetical protein DL95DRAFT_402727 [Leptodontidium sp. 2 PMI_412]|nr:hypothetical protein DL95DRAFT_402727 [Leptodontidium sp. 2 PMI_412]
MKDIWNRNTGGVGLASVICTETPVNPEISFHQHQDPASPGAAAHNKAVVLALAKSLASIGADPQEALLSGTFAPGSTSDNTGKGNTCDTADDTVGCIFTQNLLVEDATAAEISAAVAGVTASTVAASAGTTTAVAEAAATAAAAAAGSASVFAAPVVVTVTADAVAAATTAVSVASATSEAAAAATTAAAPAASAASGSKIAFRVKTYLCFRSSDISTFPSL